MPLDNLGPEARGEEEGPLDFRGLEAGGGEGPLDNLGPEAIGEEEGPLDRRGLEAGEGVREASDLLLR